MKTLLRQTPNGPYLQSPGRWTTNARKALDFHSMSRAIEMVERTGYRNLEIAFVFGGAKRSTSVRVDTLEGMEL